MSDRWTLDRRSVLKLLGGGAAASLGAAIGPQTPDDVSFGGEARPSLHTRLTRDYGVRYPFVSAGMGFVSYPPLVTAVSNAGGIGVLGNAVEPPPSTQMLIRMIAERTAGRFGVDLLHDMTAF